MVRYAVIYTTPSGGTGVVNVFNKKSLAKKQIEAIKNSESFKKLGYKRPRIRKEVSSF